MIMLASQIVGLLQALLVTAELRRLSQESQWLQRQVAALQRTAPTPQAQQSPSGLGRPPAPPIDLPGPSLASALGRPRALS